MIRSGRLQFFPWKQNGLMTIYYNKMQFNNQIIVEANTQ